MSHRSSIFGCSVIPLRKRGNSCLGLIDKVGNRCCDTFPGSLPSHKHSVTKLDQLHPGPWLEVITGCLFDPERRAKYDCFILTTCRPSHWCRVRTSQAPSSSPANYWWSGWHRRAGTRRLLYKPIDRKTQLEDLDCWPPKLQLCDSVTLQPLPTN